MGFFTYFNKTFDSRPNRSARGICSITVYLFLRVGIRRTLPLEVAGLLRGFVDFYTALIFQLKFLRLNLRKLCYNQKVL